MSKSSENTGTTTSSGGTTTGGGGTPTGPHPKRVIEIILLSAILILVAYDTYMISQNNQLLQHQQVAR